MKWAWVLVIAACDGPQQVEISAVERGAEVFRDPGFSDSQFNEFACATCHATGGDQDIALSLGRVTDRAAWWNGNIQSLGDAVDFCWVHFMRGFRGIDRSGDDGRALFEYLDSLGTGEPLPANTFTVVETVADVPRGDAERGADVYAASCAPCHGAIHTGEGRLGPLVSIVPEASIEFAEEGGFDVRLVIIEKVRHGQFFGVGGNMPFYPTEILSDEAMGDLLEYLVP